MQFENRMQLAANTLQKTNVKTLRASFEPRTLGNMYYLNKEHIKRGWTVGMFSRKEKIKASDLGKTLLVFVDVFNKQDYESIKSTIEEIQKESSLNFSQILFEYCSLKIFTVDFAVYQVLENSDKKLEILGSFYEGIEEWCNENASHFPNMYDEIKTRLLDYTVSLKDEADNVKNLGPGWPIGKVFAKYCRIGKDPAKTKIAMIGGVIFSGYLSTVMKNVDSFHIV